MKWGFKDTLVDALGALFPQKFCSGMKTISVRWLWMSQGALLCLLYLVLLTAATIHHYLVADAPNHSILPLIYLNAAPLEYPLCPSRQACCWSIYPSTFQSLHPSVNMSVHLDIHPYIHPSTHSFDFTLMRPSTHPGWYIHCLSIYIEIHHSILSCVNKNVCWNIWHIQQYCSDLSCQLHVVGKRVACYF